MTVIQSRGKFLTWELAGHLLAGSFFLISFK